MSDLISRQDAIDAVKKNTFRLIFAEEQNCEGRVAWSAYAVYSDVIEGALLELPSAQPRWIPCSKKLPERYYNYLITTGEGDTDIGTFSPEFKRWYICDADGFKRIDDVIAWMPLPEPYKGG